MKIPKPIIRGALLLALAGWAAWAASLGITLTNHGPRQAPLLLLDGELGSTNQLQFTPILNASNTWLSLAHVVITNHPTTYLDGTATNVATRYYRAQQLDGGEPPTNTLRAPIYFNLFYHQEAVGTLCTNPPFPDYHNWRSGFLNELAELDRRRVVSDQYLSDYMVDVIRHHSPMIVDPLFAIFAKNTNAHLGYHFHPASADVMIRVNQIRDLDFRAAVQAYPAWERAYYDWHPCVPPSTNCMLCGRLDTNNLTGGGIAVLQAAFGKPCVVENLGTGNAAVSLALQANYPALVTGVRGAVHYNYCGVNLPNIWKHNGDLSSDLYRYVYKVMGLHHQRGHSLAWIEPSMRLPLVEQMLALLPRDRPHIVMVHGYNGAMNGHLDLVQEFITNNPGSRFISASELPALVDTSRNSRTYLMSDLEEGAQYLLRNWQGRPPGFIVTGLKYIPLTSFFRALQIALGHYYSHQTWPLSVTVPEFILPPLGEQSDLPSMNDCRTYLPQAVASLALIIQGMSTNEIPFVVDLPPPSEPGTAHLPVRVNAAELLNGMSTLLLKHRAKQSFSDICLLKGHIIPLSNIPYEADCTRCCGTTEPPPTGECPPCQAKTNYADSRLDWYNQLQLWTLEPFDLRVVQVGPARGTASPK